MQQWLRDEGIDYPLVRGGYKAMRRFFTGGAGGRLSAPSLSLSGGKTGTGKTRVIKRLSRSVDLEGWPTTAVQPLVSCPNPSPARSISRMR